MIGIVLVVASIAALLIGIENGRLSAAVLGVIGPIVGIAGPLALWLIQQKADEEGRRQRALSALRTELETSLFAYCQSFDPLVAEASLKVIENDIRRTPGYFPLTTATSDSRIIASIGSDLLDLPKSALDWIVLYERYDKAYSEIVRLAQTAEVARMAVTDRLKLISGIYRTGELAIISAAFALRAVVRELDPSTRIGLAHRSGSSRAYDSTVSCTRPPIPRRGAVYRFPISFQSMRTLARRHRSHFPHFTPIFGRRARISRSG